MQSIKSLKQLIDLKSSAFYITEASSELVKEIQSILGVPVSGAADIRTKEALSKFKSDRNLEHPLGLGVSTAQALLDYNKPKDFANRIIAYMRGKGYKISEGERQYNIVYIEGVSENGIPNGDRFNQWNDRRLIIEVVDGNAKIVGNWLASTEPGDHYTYNPMNRKGAARIAFGQYAAWQVGMHGNSDRHEALVQTGGSVRVHRDLNKDGVRTSDAIDEGFFGINQHWGYDLPEVGKASAGCLVGQSRSGHQEFMALCKRDKRYQANREYIFTTAIIAGDDLAKK